MSSALIEVRVPPASNCDYFSKIFQATQVSKLPLRAKHGPPQAETQWLRLRDDLIALMAKETVAMAEQIERQEVTSFAVVATHQQLGDLLRNLGHGEEARRQFRRACGLLDRIVAAQPDNDVARANLGVMLQRLGETALDLDGDAAQARGEFQRTWDIQQQIAQHPRSGYYKDVDNHRLLSHAAIKQGFAEFGLGHPAERTRPIPGRLGTSHGLVEGRTSRHRGLQLPVAGRALAGYRFQPPR